jgi:Cu2+-exporting ATPase
LALAAFTLWLWGLEAGAPHAIALLIVTCPCALGLATPLAASVAQGRAARLGILIKGMRFIELLSKPALIVFDKTGTLTQGQLSIMDFTGDAELAALIRAAERGSAHPIARAFERDLPLAEVLPVSDFRETPGAGVRACVAGKDVRIGNARFVSRGCDLTGLNTRLDELLARGLSPLFVAVDGKVAAVVGVGDKLRPDARAALTELRSLGYRLALLSGDRQEIVDRVTAELGSPFELALGRQSPERKLQYIEAQRNKGPVFMVGDGVNDAAALAAAHVGIAVHGSAEASLAAADAFMTRGGTSPLVALVKGARRTSRVIYGNLALSLTYNLCAAALSVLGYISPLVAAVLMPLSSLSVLMNSLRAKTFEELP